MNELQVKSNLISMADVEIQVAISYLRGCNNIRGRTTEEESDTSKLIKVMENELRSRGVETNHITRNPRGGL